MGKNVFKLEKCQGHCRESEHISIGMAVWSSQENSHRPLRLKGCKWKFHTRKWKARQFCFHCQLLILFHVSVWISNIRALGERAEKKNLSEYVARGISSASVFILPHSLHTWTNIHIALMSDGRKRARIFLLPQWCWMFENKKNFLTLKRLQFRAKICAGNAKNLY